MKQNLLYTKNQHIQVKITDMGTEGEGIGKIDGFTLFVKDAVVGDEVEVICGDGSSYKVIVREIQ